MSRSVKKFPVIKDRARTSKDRQKPKTWANRAVRRSRDIPSGKSGFKKLYCSWNICDYRFYFYPDEKEFKRTWSSGDEHIRIWFGDNYPEALNRFKKFYIRK